MVGQRKLKIVVGLEGKVVVGRFVVVVKSRIKSKRPRQCRDSYS